MTKNDLLSIVKHFVSLSRSEIHQYKYCGHQESLPRDNDDIHSMVYYGQSELDIWLSVHSQVSLHPSLECWLTGPSLSDQHYVIVNNVQTH